METLQFKLNLSTPATPYVSDTLQGGKTISIAFPEGKRSAIFVQQSADGETWQSKQSITATPSATFNVSTDRSTYLRVLVAVCPASASYKDYDTGGGSGGSITTEIDPTVPSWAKQPRKPTYTAQEVGAMPASTKIPTKTSDLENDSGFLTQHQDISGKQDTIADLEAIRSGANLGATALQEHQDISGKADKIVDATSLPEDSSPLAGTSYKLGTIASLTINSIPTSDAETTIYFTCGEGFTMSIPDCNVVGELSAEAGKSYVMSILNGIVVMGEVESYNG